MYNATNDVPDASAYAADARRITDQRRFSAFAVMAAAAVLAWHADIVPGSLGLNCQTLGFLAAFAVLIRPSSPASLLTLAISETAAIFIALPQTNTNRMLQLFMFATLAATGIYTLARSHFRLDKSRWIELFQPLLRLQLLIVYALAGWHKLNTGFFDLQNNCAVELYTRMGMGPLPPGDLFRWPIALGTIATELSLPFLLAFRRTRNFGVWYGVAFHIVLGLAGAWSFSVTMIALLFLFAPDGFFDSAAGVLGRFRFGMGARRGARVAAATGVLAYLAGSLLAASRHASGFRPLLHAWARAIVRAYLWKGAGERLFFLFGPLLLGMFTWLWWRYRDSFLPALRCCGPIPPLFWILPALLVFDGLTPYLGLKTETAFAMYSNLRTEGNETNHLIWRHRLDLADYQKDPVLIVSANDPVLENDAKSGLEFPFYVMRQRVAELARNGVRGIAVTYVRAGKTTSVDRAEAVPELAAMPSWLERKLMRFRLIQLVGCPH